MKKIIEQLKRHEGFRPNYYLCTKGKKTIGYGRNVDDNPFTDLELSYLGRDEFSEKPMTHSEAQFLLLNDINNVIPKIRKHLIWDQLDEARRAVCINMAFQIGISGFLKFKKMLAALNDGFFDRASLEMLDSDWATQTPLRANELKIQMSTGEWAI